MFLRTVGERPRHNPHQLRCSFASCHRWFRNQSGLTKHLRSCHSGSRQATLPRYQHSLPVAQTTLPIHRYNEPSSQRDQDLTPPSTPLAGSQFSPSQAFPPEINQTPFDNGAGSPIQLPHQDGSFPPVRTFHGTSPRREESSIPEGDHPILKVFHPVINGSYVS